MILRAVKRHFSTPHRPKKTTSTSIMIILILKQQKEELSSVDRFPLELALFFVSLTAKP